MATRSSGEQFELDGKLLGQTETTITVFLTDYGRHIQIPKAIETKRQWEGRDAGAWIQVRVPVRWVNEQAGLLNVTYGAGGTRRGPSAGPVNG